MKNEKSEDNNTLQQNCVMFKCSKCGKKYKYESEKKRHEQSHFPQFKCKICHKKFSFVSALRRHEKQHNRTGAVQCTECGGAFRDETLLKRHIKYAHNDESYICINCNAHFTSEAALRTHSKSHKVDKDRKYQCSFVGCQKAFNFSHHLKHHELTHTGSKQHYCKVCGKGFIQAHHLKTHVKIHEPDEFLSCSLENCSKTFSNQYSLRRHMMTHSHKKHNKLKHASKLVKVENINSLKDSKSKHPNSNGNSLLDVKTVNSDVILNKCVDNFDYQEAEDTLNDISNMEFKNNCTKDIQPCLMSDNNNFDNTCACAKMPDDIDNKNIKETLLQSNNNTASTKNLQIEIDPLINIDSKYDLNEQFNTLTMKTTLNSDVDIGVAVTNIDREFENTDMSNAIFDNNCENALGMCLASSDDSCICAKMYNHMQKNNKDSMTIKVQDPTAIYDKGFSDSNYNDAHTNECDVSVQNNNSNNNSVIIDSVIKLNNEVSQNLFKKTEQINEQTIPYNSCKAILGNCIVSGNGTIGEGCLCAKMSKEVHSSQQEIEEITPFSQIVWT